jgi:hypothetical protein
MKKVQISCANQTDNINNWVELIEENILPDCSICLDKTKNLDGVKTQCGHHFCSECFWKWCEKSNTCPNCRAELMGIDRKEEFEVRRLIESRDLVIEQIETFNYQIKKSKDEISDFLNIIKDLHIKEKNMNYKLEQLNDEIWERRQTLNDIELYRTNRSKWIKREKHTEKLRYLRCKIEWHKKMKNVFKELQNDSWIEDEEGLKNDLDPYYDEVDISGFGEEMFIEDETGYKVAVHIKCNCSICVDNTLNTCTHDYDLSDEETDSDYSDMPSLEEIPEEDERRDHVSWGRNLIRNNGMSFYSIANFRDYDYSRSSFSLQE